MKSNPVRLFSIQAVLTLLLFLVWPKDSSHHDEAFIVFGSLISGLQIALLYFVWWRVFAKKKIAPSVIAVVIKYALLGLSFWYLNPLSSGQIKALTVGILSNPVAIILFAMTKKSDKNSE